MNFSYKESKSNKKKLNKYINSGGWEGRGGDVTRVSDFFFSKESKSENFFLRG